MCTVYIYELTLKPKGITGRTAQPLSHSSATTRQFRALLQAWQGAFVL